MVPFHHRPLPALLPLLLLYASSAPEYSPSSWAQAKAVSAISLTAEAASGEAESGGGGGGGGGGERREEVPEVQTSEAAVSEATFLNEEIGFRNDTLNSLMLPEPLVATRESPGETTDSEESSPQTPLLQVLLQSTVATTESALPAAVTAPYRPHSPGAITGVAITMVPPWVPPIHHGIHHHGGTSRFGPYFEEGADGSNVTARLGSTVRLDCKIGMLQDKTVTWLHRKDDAIHLLTVGRQAYSSDSRFSLAYRYPNNWRLQILFVTRRDEGLYECQVATHPPRVRQVFLRVTAPVLKIVDENHHEVLERYYKAGSEVELTCLASQLEEGDGVSEVAEGEQKETTTTTISPLQGVYKGAAGRVLWRHGDSAISHNSTGRGVGVNVSSDGRNVAITLTLEAARKGDGGNYTCSVGGMSSATVAIHILNGELPAAVQHGNSTMPFGVVSMWLQLCCLALSLSVITR